MGKVEFFKDKAGEYRWRLKATNGRIIADSAEGYKNQADCEAGFELVKSLSSKADVVRIED